MNEKMVKILFNAFRFLDGLHRAYNSIDKNVTWVGWSPSSERNTLHRIFITFSFNILKPLENTPKKNQEDFNLRQKDSDFANPIKMTMRKPEEGTL